MIGARGVPASFGSIECHPASRAMVERLLAGHPAAWDQEPATA